jgi:hypothetical protein
MMVEGALSGDIKGLEKKDDSNGKKDDDSKDDDSKGKKDDDSKGKKDDDSKGKKDDDSKGKKDDHSQEKGLDLKPIYDLGGGKVKIQIGLLKRMIAESVGCIRDLPGLDEMLMHMLLADDMIKTGKMNDTSPPPCNDTISGTAKMCTRPGQGGRSRRSADRGGTTSSNSNTGKPDKDKPGDKSTKPDRPDVVNKGVGSRIYDHRSDDYVVANLHPEDMAWDKSMMYNMPLDVKLGMMLHQILFGPPPLIEKPELMMDPFLMLKEKVVRQGELGLKKVYTSNTVLIFINNYIRYTIQANFTFSLLLHVYRYTSDFFRKKSVNHKIKVWPKP